MARKDQCSGMTGRLKEFKQKCYVSKVRKKLTEPAEIRLGI
jgi:hypothetical protein